MAREIQSCDLARTVEWQIVKSLFFGFKMSRVMFPDPGFCDQVQAFYINRDIWPVGTVY
jgi:hypothetical protein